MAACEGSVSTKYKVHGIALLKIHSCYRARQATASVVSVVLRVVTALVSHFIAVTGTVGRRKRETGAVDRLPNIILFIRKMIDSSGHEQSQKLHSP